LIPNDAAGDNDAAYGFIVNYGKGKNSTPTGIFTMSYYVEEDGILYLYTVRNNSWAKSGLYFIDDDNAYFESKGTIKKYNAITGDNVFTSGNSRFRVQILGNNDGGIVDTIAIELFDGTKNVLNIGTLASNTVPYSGVLIDDGYITVGLPKKWIF